MRVERELEEKRKKEKAIRIKRTQDTTIAILLEKKGQDARKWKVDELCVVVTHLRIPGDAKVPTLRADLLARFELTRHRDPAFGNVLLVDQCDMKTPGFV